MLKQTIMKRLKKIAASERREKKEHSVDGVVKKNKSEAYDAISEIYRSDTKKIDEEVNELRVVLDKQAKLVDLSDAKYQLVEKRVIRRQQSKNENGVDNLGDEELKALKAKINMFRLSQNEFAKGKNFNRKDNLDANAYKIRSATHRQQKSIQDTDYFPSTGMYQQKTLGKTKDLNNGVTASSSKGGNSISLSPYKKIGKKVPATSIITKKNEANTFVQKGTPAKLSIAMQRNVPTWKKNKGRYNSIDYNAMSGKDCQLKEHRNLRLKTAESQKLKKKIVDLHNTFAKMTLDANKDLSSSLIENNTNKLMQLEEFRQDRIRRTERILNNIETTDAKLIPLLYDYKVKTIINHEEEICDVMEKFHSMLQDPNRLVAKIERQRCSQKRLKKSILRSVFV